MTMTSKEVDQFNEISLEKKWMFHEFIINCSKIKMSKEEFDRLLTLVKQDSKAWNSM